LHFAECFGRALDFVEHNEGLAFSFEICLGDEVDDGSIFREYPFEGFFKLIGLDALFEVLDL
jgi:hypothetical protein